MSERIVLLTGGGDKPYALDMAAALTSAGVSLDFISSDDLQTAEMLGDPQIHFLNLRGDQRPDASMRENFSALFCITSGCSAVRPRRSLEFFRNMPTIAIPGTRLRR